MWYLKQQEINQIQSSCFSMQWEYRGKAVCRLQRKWQKNIIALCQHQPCIALDRGIKAKEMRYTRVYDVWETMKSQK